MNYDRPSFSDEVPPIGNKTLIPGILTTVSDDQKLIFDPNGVMIDSSGLFKAADYDCAVRYSPSVRFAPYKEAARISGLPARNPYRFGAARPSLSSSIPPKFEPEGNGSPANLHVCAVREQTCLDGDVEFSSANSNYAPLVSSQ